MEKPCNTDCYLFIGMLVGQEPGWLAEVNADIATSTSPSQVIHH